MSTQDKITNRELLRLRLELGRIRSQIARSERQSGKSTKELDAAEASLLAQLDTLKAASAPPPKCVYSAHELAKILECDEDDINEMESVELHQLGYRRVTRRGVVSYEALEVAQ